MNTMAVLYKENLQFVANGEMYSGRTYGIGDVGILTPSIEYSGIVGEVLVGETVVAGDLLYPKDAATSYFMLADPTQAAIKGPANCMALEGGTVGTYVLAIFDGYVKNSAWLTTEYLCSKARAVFTLSDVTVDAQTITMNTAVLGNDISDDGIVAGSSFVVVPSSTSVADFEAVTTKTLLNVALAALSTDPMVRVETTWNGSHELDFVAVNAGVAGNLFPATETFTNGAWGAALFAGGTSMGVVYCGDSGKPACAANIPATTNDMVQVIGQAISPTELLFRPITDYDLSA